MKCKEVEKELSNADGRILIRKSGTEELLRILVESNDLNLTEDCSNQITELALELS